MQKRNETNCLCSRLPSHSSSSNIRRTSTNGHTPGWEGGVQGGSGGGRRGRLAATRNPAPLFWGSVFLGSGGNREEQAVHRRRLPRLSRFKASALLSSRVTHARRRETCSHNKVPARISTHFMNNLEISTFSHFTERRVQDPSQRRDLLSRLPAEL